MSGDLSMDQVLLRKLNDVLEDNVANELFGVKELTEELGMSRAQLHRKLHDLTGKSTSQFIREFRLEKAMEMLQNNVATASEIAYRVGFKSPTYFNTSFHAYYGYPPGEVKYENLLPEEDRKNTKVIKQNRSDRDVSVATTIKKISFRQQMIFLFSLGLLLIIAFSYYYYFSSNDNIVTVETESTINEKSIAIIPFKNLSDKKEDEYFTAGVMESVQNQLNKIAGLKVISGKSMEKYADTSMAASQIANEVGASRLLEGSVQIIKDSIRIIIHIINGQNNNQLYSMIFDEEFNNFFTIQSNIAKQVAEELNIILSPLEIEQIEKKPTDNIEAYKLFMLANQRWGGDKNGWTNAIALYEKAILLDSTFIEAYINEAYTYLNGAVIFTGYINEREAWGHAKRLLLKAQQIDNSNSEINKKLAFGSYIYEWDFKRMEKEYKDHILSYVYEIHTGRFEESLAEVNQYLRDNPTNSINYAQKAQSLFFLNRREEAISFLKTNDSLFNDDAYLSTAARYYFYMGEYENSKILINNILTDRRDSLRLPLAIWLNAVYAKKDNNIEKVNAYLDELYEKYEKEASGSPAWFVALYYCAVNDYENAFTWLQKSYDRHEAEMLWLREEPLLIPVRNDERYQKLYKKVGFPMEQHRLPE